MRDPASFTDGENWTGGFYELAVEVGDTSDDRLQYALTSLWRAAAISGCHTSRDSEPAAQEQVACTVTSLEAYGHLHGTVGLPSGHRVVCGCLAVREDDGPDWLDFYLPLGALARVDARVGAFPFGDDGGAASLVWRRGLDEWLATVGMRIFQAVPFRLGLIGFEVLGEVDARELDGAARSERREAYLLPVGGTLRFTPAGR